MVPVPTHKISAPLTMTCAGFEGETALLESLYKRLRKVRKSNPASTSSQVN